MEEEILDWLSVETEAAANALTGESARYIEPFIGREASVSEAARILHVSPNTLLYHVKKFMKLGVLEVVRQERRVGKPIKFYRTKADTLFVPFSLSSAETIEALLLPLEREWQARFLRSVASVMQGDEANMGIRIWRLPSGEVISKPSLEPPAPFDESLFERWPVLVAWSELYLGPDDVEALQRDLIQIFERYSACEGKTKHLFKLGLVPSA